MEPVRFPPDRVIETRNLRLRPILASDLDAYYALCSDALVMRTWGTPVHASPEETRRLIAFLDDAFRSGTMVRWAITEKGSDTLIGDVGYWRFVKERYRAECGAKLARAYWSHGYMTQALAGIIAFGFERMGLHSVEANVDPTNGAALKLVEKVGFVREGLLREHSYDPTTGRFTDTALFSAIKGTWRPPA